MGANSFARYPMELVSTMARHTEAHCSAAGVVRCRVGARASLTCLEAVALKERDLRSWLGIWDELRNWLVTAV